MPPKTGAGKSSAQDLIDSTRRKDLWTVLIGLRIVNALTLWTFFQPDEYYQALEPAWALAFGKGVELWQDGAYDGPWITWEWKEQIRSSMYPMLYAAVYKVVGTFADFAFPPVIRTKLLIYAPKLVQAVGAAAMDIYTYKLAGRVYGVNSNEAWATLGLAVFSPWQWFVSTRSMSNCLEATLTVIALYFWPWEWVKGSTDKKAREKDTNNLKYPIILAGIAGILRPTNAIIWVILALFTLPRATQREFFAMVNAASIWGSAVLIASMSADYVYYGEVTFPPVNFVKFNLDPNIKTFYGQNRIDYYFTEGIPMLLMTALPFAITGLSQALAGRFLTLPADTESNALQPTILRALATVAISLPLVLSFVPHKEARFIYPILPILFVIIARPFIAFFHPFPNPTSDFRKTILASLVGINVILSLYLGCIHNAGVINAINYVRQAHEKSNPGMVKHGITTNMNKTTVSVLMPCHSVPWRSQLVYPDINIWAITCDPPVNSTFAAMLKLDPEAEIDEDNYIDETDKFYKDVDRWIRLEFGTQRRGWTDYVIMHEHMEDILRTKVAKHAFEVGFKKFNTFFTADERRQGKIVIWAKTIPYGGPGQKDNPLLELPDEDESDEIAKVLQGIRTDPAKQEEIINIKENLMGGMHGGGAGGPKAPAPGSGAKTA